jgi:hypothetical protein
MAGGAAPVAKTNRRVVFGPVDCHHASSTNKIKAALCTLPAARPRRHCFARADPVPSSHAHYLLARFILF